MSHDHDDSHAERAAVGQPAEAAEPAPLGTTRPVWSVIGPGTKHRPGAWFVARTFDAAAAQARAMRRAQIHEGTEVLSETDDGLRYWAVERPEWVAPRP